MFRPNWSSSCVVLVIWFYSSRSVKYLSVIRKSYYLRAGRIPCRSSISLLFLGHRGRGSLKRMERISLYLQKPIGLADKIPIKNKDKFTLRYQVQFQYRSLGFLKDISRIFELVPSSHLYAKCSVNCRSRVSIVLTFTGEPWLVIIFRTWKVPSYDPRLSYRLPKMRHSYML
jgi:hypothetical protein